MSRNSTHRTFFGTRTDFDLQCEGLEVRTEILEHCSEFQGKLWMDTSMKEAGIKKVVACLVEEIKLRPDVDTQKSR